MAESDSAAESSNLMLEVKEILATPWHEQAMILVCHLYMGQETDESQAAHALYNLCTARYPSCLTVKLLKVYQCSSNAFIRSRSIYLLSETLTELRNSGFEFSLVALSEIKPLLLSCLAMQESKEANINTLGRIVSIVAYNVMKLDNGRWDDLRDCILLFANSEPLKAFHVFLELPPLNKDFIDRYMDKLVEQIHKVLNNPDAKDWSLALQTYAKLGIQILHSEMGTELIRDKKDFVKIMFENLSNSAKKLLKKGMDQSLLQGLQDLDKLLSRDENLYKYNIDQCVFVCLLAHKFRRLGTGQTEETVRKIIDRFIGKHSIDPDVKIILQQREEQLDHDREWFKHFNSLSPLELLRTFASEDVEERCREMAIIRLNFLLSRHTSKEKVIEDISVFKQLKPLLISCLWEEGISENSFKILAQVVHQVAYEMFVFYGDTWYALRNYIESKCETEFERAVYIFQGIPTMPLDHDEFLIPVTYTLLPEMGKRLITPPKEFSINNNSWVLAFTGAFCAVMHLIKIQSAEEIVYIMIESVKELVGRRMEVGIVRRAFRDVESAVKKQLEWYGPREYKFLKGLLWRLYGIKGMKMESKLVLWRINLILEREVAKQDKELPKNEFDWKNQHDDDEDYGFV